MRQKCQTKRSSRPDLAFIRAVKNYWFDWLDDEPIIPEEDDPYAALYDEDEDEYELEEDDLYEEDDPYEDEISRATDRAGFHMNDDGDWEYNDEDQW